MSYSKHFNVRVYNASLLYQLSQSATGSQLENQQPSSAGPVAPTTGATEKKTTLEDLILQVIGK
jgi:hypothetical protein